MQIENVSSEYTENVFFSPDLFYQYSEIILRELEDLLRFIIGEYNLNNTCCTDFDGWFRRKQKVKEQIDEGVNENKKKRWIINFRR